MSYDKACEKLHAAVDLLVTGEGSVQQRLAAAYHDAIRGLNPAAELPSPFLAEFTEIQQQLEDAVPQDVDSDLSGLGLHPITVSEASQFAHRIFELFCRLLEYRTNENVRGT